MRCERQDLEIEASASAPQSPLAQGQRRRAPSDGGGGRRRRRAGLLEQLEATAAAAACLAAPPAPRGDGDRRRAEHRAAAVQAAAPSASGGGGAALNVAEDEAPDRLPAAAKEKLLAQQREIEQLRARVASDAPPTSNEVQILHETLGQRDQELKALIAMKEEGEAQLRDEQRLVATAFYELSLECARLRGE